MRRGSKSVVPLLRLMTNTLPPQIPMIAEGVKSGALSNGRVSP
jgi:hypothetical protein